MLQATVAKVKLGQLFKLNDTTSFFSGQFPNGIPLTIELTGWFIFAPPHFLSVLIIILSFFPNSVTPPILFETKCSPDSGVSFGGCPTVYLHNAGPNVFHVRSLKSQKLVRKAQTCVDCYSINFLCIASWDILVATEWPSITTWPSSISITTSRSFTSVVTF